MNKIDNRYMEIRLGNQHFAIPLLAVKEVIQKPEMREVPNMPAHFEGMINLRGQVMGIYNVRKRLSTGNREKSEAVPEVVVVIEHQGVNVGMMVDEVIRVLHAKEDMIREAPLKQGDPAAEYITSVIHHEGKMILTIAIHRLLELDKYRPTKQVA